MIAPLSGPCPAAPADQYAMTYLSLGAGVQSTALLVASALGLHGVPRIDVAIFADTQDEPAYVYEHLARLEDWACERGVVVVERVTAGKLSQKVLGGVPTTIEGDCFITIPAFVRGADGRAAPLRRQCTREYKIDPIRRRVRAMLGYGPGERMAGKVMVRCLLGISLDEAHRMKDSRDAWCENVYPLVDARLRREDCAQLIADAGLPVPEKSACVYCPYHSDRYWRALRARYPGEFARACVVDEAIRGSQVAYGEVFLHRSLKPLREVCFDDRQGELFGSECEGYCGV